VAVLDRRKEGERGEKLQPEQTVRNRPQKKKRPTHRKKKRAAWALRRAVKGILALLNPAGNDRVQEIIVGSLPPTGRSRVEKFSVSAIRGPPSSVSSVHFRNHAHPLGSPPKRAAISPDRETGKRNQNQAEKQRDKVRQGRLSRDEKRSRPRPDRDRDLPPKNRDSLIRRRGRRELFDLRVRTREQRQEKKKAGGYILHILLQP